jgi:hypothetical protein
MEHTQEIPHARCHDFLSELSKRQKDHPVRVRVEREDIGDQVLAEYLPLIGIDVDEKGSDRGAIDIAISAPPTGSITHVVQSPKRLFRYGDADDEADVKVLAIEDSADARTLIFF